MSPSIFSATPRLGASWVSVLGLALGVALALPRIAEAQDPPEPGPAVEAPAAPTPAQPVLTPGSPFPSSGQGFSTAVPHPASLSEPDLAGLATLLGAVQAAAASGDQSRVASAFAALPMPRRDDLVRKVVELAPAEFRLDTTLDDSVEELEAGTLYRVHVVLSTRAGEGAGQWFLSGIPASLTVRRGPDGGFLLVDTDLDRYLVSPAAALKVAGGACAAISLAGLLYVAVVLWLAVDCGRRSWAGRESRQVLWFVALFAGCGIGPLLYLGLVKARQWNPRHAPSGVDP